ncbi:L-A virus GAG protein N-acetyltransferase [Uncinocarpus reesii 1704]|uniref:L-A virus GAG protein N-acetyltransferase n=1 Tax=Uncinocarpus reesii (strain UAMH 1704) TaxID=336963 RepID=C4JWE2_UNCRE|nr:L-A virus GAG protein N-acetyltransferase [Uncinocarpus reesii 1704]EEP82019.1 L-A virus GAG protein N-acetyltransferase [Uncinocarpus reesii 1704]
MTDPSPPSATKVAGETASPQFRYIQYDNKRENEYVPAMRQLISKVLSEPYSIYVYRYFLYQWGSLCYMAMDQNNELAGVVISKLEPHRGVPLRGYIAMLAVPEKYRGQGIATKLVCMAIDAMIERNADETETTNTPAMKLYERLGFLRSKQLHRYYLNGNSAFRLVLYLKEGVSLLDAYGCPHPPPVAGEDDDGLPLHEDGEYLARHNI